MTDVPNDPFVVPDMPPILPIGNPDDDDLLNTSVGSIDLNDDSIIGANDSNSNNITDGDTGSLSSMGAFSFSDVMPGLNNSNTSNDNSNANTTTETIESSFGNNSSVGLSIGGGKQKKLNSKKKKKKIKKVMKTNKKKKTKKTKKSQKSQKMKKTKKVKKVKKGKK